LAELGVYFRRKKDVNFLISLPSKPRIVQKTQRRRRDFLLKKSVPLSLSRTFVCFLDDFHMLEKGL
jgi:hypothetical protein